MKQAAQFTNDRRMILEELEKIQIKPVKTSKIRKKQQFLESIKSKSGRTKFKRCNLSPLRYGGGKSLAVGTIIENLPNELSKLVSPFFGGGSLEIACSKELEMEVIGYDIFDILVNYWQHQTRNQSELYEKLQVVEPTKQNYKLIKDRLKEHWQNSSKLDGIDLAFHYFFNHNLSYGPGFLGWMSSIYEKKERYLSAIERVRDFKPKNLSVFCKTFEESILSHKQDFLYCDPPYFLEGDSKMFRGIYPQRNFPIHHNGFDHQKLCNLLKKHKGGFLLSYNDCLSIRDLYKNFKIIEVEWQYTMGQGETRIGKNRIENSVNHIKKSHEILIIGY